jgi:hypothetical protein
MCNFVNYCCYFCLQGNFLAGLGGDRPTELVRNVMDATMTIPCVRLFTWTAFTETDKADGIMPKLEDGSLCTHRSKFSRMKGIISVVWAASDKNLGMDTTHAKVTQVMKTFFNYATERDPTKVAHRENIDSPCSCSCIFFFLTRFKCGYA